MAKEYIVMKDGEELKTYKSHSAAKALAEKVAVLDGGTVVEVGKRVDDWLHLTDGTFIYYEGGKNARKE